MVPMELTFELGEFELHVADVAAYTGRPELVDPGKGLGDV
jgi:hypothetical protein